jgi:hypothetical protein
MNPIEQYRARAAEFEARARQEMDPAVRIEWENIARSYLRLAEQAVRSKAPAAAPAYQPYVPAQPQQVAHIELTPHTTPR